MLDYYLRLAVRSLRTHPPLTALIVCAVAIGISVSMTAFTLARAMSGDPIPAKSAQLFVPQLDNWGPDARKNGEPPDMLSHRDAMALMQTKAAKRQTALYAAAFNFIPANADLAPFHISGRAAFADFFTMFDVPFRYGQPWTAADDDARANVVVLSADLNDQLFHGADSVGRTINLDGITYRVVGVLKEWRPQPRIYDVINASFGETERMYLPFNTAVGKRAKPRGYSMCQQPAPPAWEEYLNSDCVWIQFWIEAPTAADAGRYRQFLHHYASEQQSIGRFAWAPLVRLRNAREWLEYRQVVPAGVSVTLLLSVFFLFVCLLNSAGLMLAKLARRVKEVGIRRALGASRRDIFLQYLVEAATIGSIGGIVGLGLTAIGLAAQRSVLPGDLRNLAQFDGVIVALVVGVSILATVCAGSYPAWRASGATPASVIRRS